MPKQESSIGKSGKKGFVVGRAGFTRIGAVEGVRQKPAMEKRAAKSAGKDLSADEYRKLILRTFRKA